MPAPRRSRREVRYSLRLPEDVHEAVAEIALLEGRSLNREIEMALRAHIAAWRRRHPRPGRDPSLRRVVEGPAPEQSAEP